MKLFGKDLDLDVVVVAEIGVNHEGDPAAAQRMISLAKSAGADAVKLQTYNPDRYASATDSARLERVRRFSLDFDAHRTLATFAEGIGIPLFSTALTEDVVSFLASWCPVIKIASGDLDFEPTVRGVAATGKPLIISTGNGTEEEIARAVAWCAEEIGESLLPARLALMHCVSAYPAPIDQANVLSVPFLKERFGLTTGYSNHVVEPEAVLAAVALGARLIEIHMTDKKEGRQFRDHAMSFEPEELTLLIKSIRRVEVSLGNLEKKRQPCEVPLINAMRKGVVAAKDLPKGTVLARADLMFARPAENFRALQVVDLIGRTLVNSLKRGESLSEKNLQ